MKVIIELKFFQTNSERIKQTITFAVGATSPRSNLNDSAG